LNRKLATLTATALIALIVLSLFFALNWFSNQPQTRHFYVGVEYAYGNNQTGQAQVSQVQALVDKVKDYTNLFVIGSVGLTFDRTALTQACDYIIDAKLNLIVLFTGLTEYTYITTAWMTEAKAKYGEKFLGIYRYDEPGGHQLDQGPSALVNETEVNTSNVNITYTEVADHFVSNLKIFPSNYLMWAPQVFTADYGLYWFGYKSGYSAIFAEFVGNESRQRIIALDRGAAKAFNKDWGVIINWKYDQPGSPYLESGDELFTDLSLAYSSGAKYGIVFSYPQIGTYGTLTDDHFVALQKFWNTLHSNPASFGSNKPEAAYVVPADYGFGFRNPNDTIWGLFPADTLSPKIYADINTLTARYGSRFDILYDEPQATSLMNGYSQVFFWNQTIT